MITRRLGRSQDFEGVVTLCFVPSIFVNFKPWSRKLLSTFVFPRYRLRSGRRSNEGRRCHLHVESAHSYRLVLHLKNRFTRWSGDIHTVQSFRAILSLFWDQDKSLSFQMWCSLCFDSFGLFFQSCVVYLYLISIQEDPLTYLYPYRFL